jgi:hypothetical protein
MLVAGVDDLECHRALELDVAAIVDLGHAAPSQQTVDAKIAKLLSD